MNSLRAIHYYYNNSSVNQSSGLTGIPLQKGHCNNATQPRVVQFSYDRHHFDVYNASMDGNRANNKFRYFCKVHQPKILIPTKLLFYMNSVYYTILFYYLFQKWGAFQPLPLRGPWFRRRIALNAIFFQFTQE